MTFWEWIADRRIRDGFAEGQFDNLPGAGKPLVLEEDALIPAAWRAAFHLLSQSGLAPAWIMLDAQIRQEQLVARQAYARAVAQLDDRDPGYRRAVEQFRRRVAEINRGIDDFNLQVPLPHLVKGRMRADVEMARIIHLAKQACTEMYGVDKGT